MNDTVTIGKGSIVDIQIYDVLDNRQLSKLMRSISKLSKKEFKVDLRYKTSRFKQLNYIRPQFDHTSTATLADIEFKGDSLISALHISWTQINNDEAIIKYSFNFSKPIYSLEQCRQNILERWMWAKSVSAMPYYHSVETIFEKNDYMYNMFLSIFQGFIVKNLYSHLGSRYRLPTNVLQHSKTNKDINKLLSDEHLYAHVYKHTKRNTYIIHDPMIDKWLIRTVVTGRSCTNEDLLGYFSQYGMNYYYFIFGDIEINELSIKLMGYLNSGKTKLSFKNRKWLFRKFRRVSEVKLFSYEDREIDTIVGVSKDINQLKYGGRNLAKRFKAVYEDNLKYTDSVFGLTDVHIWVWIVLVISVASIAATIFQFFFPSMEDLIKYLSNK